MVRLPRALLQRAVCRSLSGTAMLSEKRIWSDNLPLNDKEPKGHLQTPSPLPPEAINNRRAYGVHDPSHCTERRPANVCTQESRNHLPSMARLCGLPLDFLSLAGMPCQASVGKDVFGPAAT